MDLKFVINYIRNRPYMSGIDRDNIRIKSTAEVFTPTEFVIYTLDKLDQSMFNQTETFCDPCCGDGQFIGEILIRKMEYGSSFEEALSTVYGVDLMQDNIDLCRDRLLCGREDLRWVVEKNIVCADALRYHYRFDGSHPYDDELKLIAEKKVFGNLFELKEPK